ncbi:MAG: GNAT family N-acetyltransferase [Thaumarchaeota archaeon]|nr:GNAT family N-acetyltransferase [Nitrososphaerota archaeon]
MYLIKTNRGARYWGDDPLAVGRGGRVLKLHASAVRGGDRVRWESKRAVSRRKRLFLEELSEKDPTIKPSLDYYYDHGNYYEQFHKAFGYLSRKSSESDLMRGIVSGMRRQKSHAKTSMTFRDWLDLDDAPWFPQKHGDIAKLARVLKGIARNSQTTKAVPYINRLQLMGRDGILRDAVVSIRGWWRKWGRRSTPRRLSNGDKQHRSAHRSNARKGGGSSPLIKVNKAFEKSLEIFRKQILSLPLETFSFWASVKARPHQVKAKHHKSRRSFDLPTFRDGPVVGTDELLSRLGRQSASVRLGPARRRPTKRHDEPPTPEPKNPESRSTQPEPVAVLRPPRQDVPAVPAEKDSPELTMPMPPVPPAGSPGGQDAAAGEPAQQAAIGENTPSSGEVQLKDGRKVNVRRMGPGDMENLVRFYEALSPEILRWALPPYDRTRVERFFGNPQHFIGVVAETGDRIVGHLQIIRYLSPRMNHVGELAVYLDQDYLGVGLGRAMLKSGIALARANGLRRIGLSVVAGNERSLWLFEKAGFVREGVRKGAYLTEDGKCLDTVEMGFSFETAPAPSGGP